jgi:hypothetical protein
VKVWVTALINWAEKNQSAALTAGLAGSEMPGPSLNDALNCMEQVGIATGHNVGESIPWTTSLAHVSTGRQYNRIRQRLASSPKH